MFGEGSLPFDRVELSYKISGKSRSSSRDAKALLPLESLGDALSAGKIFVTRGEPNGLCDEPARIGVTHSPSAPLEFVLQWGTRPDVLFHAERSQIPTVQDAKQLAAIKASLLTGDTITPSGIRLMALQMNPATRRLQLLPVESYAQLQQASAVQVTQAMRSDDDDPFV